MKISCWLYTQNLSNLPQKGQHILAHQTDKQIVLYQAYKKSIAEFAVKNQFLGGPDFNFNRMSWVKPNFLWMMYRCGWAEKENQEHVLALYVDRSVFEEILQQSVFSAFKPEYYESYDKWKIEMEAKDVRLQWDPDHDPFGNKVERRAIQLGLKGNVLKNFCSRLNAIEDITPFVKQQKQLLDNGRLEELLVPVETIFCTADKALNRSVGIELES